MNRMKSAFSGSKFFLIFRDNLSESGHHWQHEKTNRNDEGVKTKQRLMTVDRRLGK